LFGRGGCPAVGLVLQQGARKKGLKRYQGKKIKEISPSDRHKTKGKSSISLGPSLKES